MSRWEAFERDGITYDLSHLDADKFVYTRSATEHSEAKNYSVFVAFSDHCFTDHHGEDDSWLYPFAYSQAERFFCKTRYSLSKYLPKLIRELLDNNPYLLLTFARHREQFFYLEQDFHGETYRVFLEVSAPNADYADIRIDVKSAYDEKQWANPVAGSDHYRLWRIIDAKLKGIGLARKRKR